MEETLRQLGEIALGSIPTILLFLIVYTSYRFLVHNPLEKILAERHQRCDRPVQRYPERRHG